MSAKRYSWYLPYMESPTSEESKTNAGMDNEQATFWLSQFIGKNLRIHASDGRVFAGQMKCTDRDRNIILSLAYEYRAPSAEAIRKAVEESGSPSASVTWNSRYVGLVVVPGQHVKKIEFEESTLPGQKNEGLQEAVNKLLQGSKTTTSPNLNRMSLNISTTAAIRRRFDTGSTHLAFRSSIRPSATQMPSPLLELPSELRNMIWEYALTNDTRSLRYNPDTKRFDVSQIGAGLLAAPAPWNSPAPPHSFKLILTARRTDRLHALAAQITQELGSGVKVHVVDLDVSESEEVAGLFGDLPPEFRDVDVLVNNAGFMSGVITVDPGQVLTEFTIIRNRGDEASANKVYEGCDPLTPDHIAEVVVFALQPVDERTWWWLTRCCFRIIRLRRSICTVEFDQKVDVSVLDLNDCSSAFALLNKDEVIIHKTLSTSSRHRLRLDNLKKANAFPWHIAAGSASDVVPVALFVASSLVDLLTSPVSASPDEDSDWRLLRAGVDCTAVTGGHFGGSAALR
ncbi:hypothetical protein ST47_g9733 [Ascochyta rabiei]|uniref:Uncharacterized protein n=1 Tax=Didymella rabiei TaxID=5454 RepID=A0A162WMH8_DIDRA|nr:hypothetical protein ST47_g9733 [Ascochyta rabiei]